METPKASYGPQVPWHQDLKIPVDNSRETKIIKVHNITYLELMKLAQKDREIVLKALCTLYGVYIGGN